MENNYKEKLEEITLTYAYEEISKHIKNIPVYKDISLSDDISIYIESVDYKHIPSANLILCWNMLYTNINSIWIANHLFSMYQITGYEINRIQGSFVSEPLLNRIIAMNAKVKILTDSNIIEVDADIRIECITKESDWIILRLNPSFFVNFVSYAGNPLHFEYLDVCHNGIQIFLDNTLVYGEQIVINMKYSGNPLLRVPNYLEKQSGLIWSESNILPITNFFPRDKYTLQVEYLIDNELDIVTCGELLYKGNGNEIWKSQKSMLGLSFTYGSYQYTRVRLEEIECNFYIARGNDIDVEELSKRIQDILNFFVPYLGEIPYSSLNICFNDNFSICCINSNILYLYRIDDIAISHELAHLWWGMSITGNGPGWRWIHEGFADFFSELYLWNKIGIMEEELHKIAHNTYYDTIELEPLDLLEVCFGMDDGEYERYKDYVKKYIKLTGWNNFICNIKAIIKTYEFQSITVKELIGYLEVLHEGL